MPDTDEQFMANLTGFVLLHKSIRRNAIWRREPFTYGQAFADLIMLAVDAASAPQTVWVQGEQIVLERGQVGWSVSKLAEEWQRNRPWVDRFLRVLQDKGMATVDSNHRRTIITILNYDTYQADVATGIAPHVAADVATGIAHKGKGERGNGKEVKGNDNPPLPEIPDERTLAEWFAAFTDLSRAVQGIPEMWWRGWVSDRLERRRWPADWQAAARNSFLADHAARYPKALGIAQGKKNAAEARLANEKTAAGGRTPAQARFEVSRALAEVQERLEACHEANLEPDRRDVERERELKKQLKELESAN